MIWLMSLAMAQNYSFPTSDADYGTFYPTAYYDHGGSTDWNCGGLTYTGHRGNDFGVGGFTGMDAGRDVVAAADGEVIYTNDGEFDRCTTGACAGGSGFGNWVKIRHADGKETIYGHLKQWSVLVTTGQRVTCGQKLGEAASSGHSTGPHLHFEVRSGGVGYDPFDGPCSHPPSWWVSQGSHGGVPARTCGDPQCTPVDTLSCGQTVSSSNQAPGSTSVMATYACSTFSYSGPERTWTLIPTFTEQVTVRLTGLGADLDLMVIDSSGGCKGGSCIGGSVGSGTADEAVTFSAIGGHAYYIVADGWDGAVSNFNLAASCTPPGCHGATPVGHADYCGAGCTCAAGQGDCDGGVTCDPGLVCVIDDGARFGFDPITDVCEAPFACADDTSEPDDSSGAPRTITADTTQSSLKRCPLDDDWIALPMSTGDMVFSSIDFDPVDADLDLYLYDGAGTLVGASEGVTGQESVSGTAGSPGTWLVNVKLYADGSGPAGGGAYTLGVDYARAFALTVPELRRGQPATLQVQGARPGKDVALAWGAGAPGPGVCPAALYGQCVDLIGAHYMFKAPADANGDVSWTLQIPPTLSGTFSLQAYLLDGFDTLKSAPVTRSIQP